MVFLKLVLYKKSGAHDDDRYRAVMSVVFKLLALVVLLRQRARRTTAVRTSRSSERVLHDHVHALTKLAEASRECKGRSWAAHVRGVRHYDTRFFRLLGFFTPYEMRYIEEKQMSASDVLHFGSNGYIFKILVSFHMLSQNSILFSEPFVYVHFSCLHLQCFCLG